MMDSKRVKSAVENGLRATYQGIQYQITGYYFHRNNDNKTFADVVLKDKNGNSLVYAPVKDVELIE